MDKEQLKALGEKLKKSFEAAEIDEFMVAEDVTLKFYEQMEKMVTSMSMSITMMPAPADEKVKRLMEFISISIAGGAMLYLKKLSQAERLTPGFKENFLEFCEGVYDHTLEIMTKEFK